MLFTCETFAVFRDRPTLEVLGLHCHGVNNFAGYRTLSYITIINIKTEARTGIKIKCRRLAASGHLKNKVFIRNLPEKELKVPMKLLSRSLDFIKVDFYMLISDCNLQLKYFSWFSGLKYRFSVAETVWSTGSRGDVLSLD